MRRATKKATNAIIELERYGIILPVKVAIAVRVVGLISTNTAASPPYFFQLLRVAHTPMVVFAPFAVSCNSGQPL